jgi:hypothetical protein
LYNGESYELKFLSRNYARFLTAIDTTTVAISDEEHNLNIENVGSKNIYIRGDNIEGLIKVVV